MNGNPVQRKDPGGKLRIQIVLLPGLAAVALAVILAVQSVPQGGMAPGLRVSGGGAADRTGPGPGAAPGDTAVTSGSPFPPVREVPSGDAAPAGIPGVSPSGTNGFTILPNRNRSTVRTHPHADRVQAPAIGPDSATGEDPNPMLYALDREGVRTAIQDLTPQVKDCYQSWLDFDPAMEGKFRVRFVIENVEDRSYSRVASVNLADSELDNPLMEGCIMNLVVGLRFAPSESGGRTVVSYPFIFRRV